MILHEEMDQLSDELSASYTKSRGFGGKACVCIYAIPE